MAARDLETGGSKDPPWLRGAWLVPLLIGFGSLFRGFPSGTDWHLEMVRVVEFGNAVAAGQVPPMWAENLYGGYGSPIFLFYAPLFASVASAFSAVVGSIDVGAAAALLAAAAAMAVATYRAVLLATDGSRIAARAATIVYALNPYLLCNIYHRNACAEFLGLCLAPLVIGEVLRIRRRPVSGALGLGASLALLIVAHNLTALFVAAIAFALGVSLYGVHRRGRFPFLVRGMVLGILLAAFFWIPAVGLADLVRTDDLLTGRFDYRYRFVGILSIFDYGSFYGMGWMAPVILAAGAAFAILGIHARLSRSAPEDTDAAPAKGHGGAPVDTHRLRLLAASLLGSALLVFLMTEYSRRIWETVPFMPYVQFPWRLQGPLALFTALTGAMVIAHLAGRFSPRKRVVLEVFLLALVTANALPRLTAARPLDASQRARIPAMLSPEGIRAGENTATVRNEYLPRTADKSAWRTRPPGPGGVIDSVPEMRIEVVEERGWRIRLRVRPKEPAWIVFGRWSFPGWRLSIDGKEAAVRYGPDGTISAIVPAGASKISLTYTAPWQRRLGMWVTGLSLFMAMALWFGLARRERRGAPAVHAGSTSGSSEASR
jgi:hypothetical protein